MDTPLDLTGRYKEKTIHKFLKDDILDIIRSQNAIFQPFFDPEMERLGIHIGLSEGLRL